MASTYSNRLKIERIGDGEQAGSWGDTTNDNFGAATAGGASAIEHAIAGVLTIAVSGDITLTTGDGPTTQALNQARQACLIFTGSTTATVTVPNTEKIYHIYNNSSAVITLRITGTSTDFVMAAETSYLIACTGSAWHALNDDKVHFTAAGIVSNTSGDITVDSAADIVLDADGGDVFVKDAGTTFGSLTNSSGNLIIKSGTTTAATFSGANVTFAGTIASGALDTGSANITSGGLLKIDVDADADDLTGDSTTGRLTLGAGEDLNLYHGGTNSYIVNDTGDLIVDTAGDIILDADGGDITLKDGGTEFGNISNSSSDLLIQSAVSDKDIIFKGNDGGSTITALTLDMSAGGAATFRDDVTAFSDERLKTDIKTIDNALNKVCDMRGVYFNKDGAAGTGVIAQEIQDILPEVVHDKQEYLSVAYGNMVGVLIEAIKELKKEVETLKESK